MATTCLRFAMLGLLLCARPAAAQEALGPPEATEATGLSGLFAAGAGITPAYDGAKTYRIIPFVLSDMKWRGLTLEVRGLRARLDVLGDSPIQVGPAMNFRFKRDSKDADGRVTLLNDVNTAVEVGGFVGYRLGGDAKGQGEISLDLTVMKDVAKGHNGLLGTAQIGYAAYRSSRFFVNVDAQSNIVDAKYMRSYFGVSPAEAVRSGLAAYRPGGGVKDVGAGLTIGYQLTPQWGVIARAGANYLIGDANKSPVVREGSKFQATVGAALSFRF